MIYDLVFEGGGAKGMVFAGVMAELEAEGHQFGRLLGTSAGAITATLLAAGYDGQGLLDAVTEKVNGRSVFSTFMGSPSITETDLQRSALQEILEKLDVPLLPDSIEKRVDALLVEAMMSSTLIRHLFSFIELGGWYASHALVEWMTLRLNSGLFKGQPRKLGDLSFRDFHAATGVDLSLIASDTTHQSLLILNHRTAPDLPIVHAVHMSMSIPMLWQEIIWKEEWGHYRGQTMTGATIVDGGVLSNFPIELFVSDEPQVRAVMGEGRADAVLGLLIDEKLEVEGLSPEPPKTTMDLGQERVAQRLQRLVATVVKARDQMVLDAFDHLVAHLPAKGFGTTEFDMTDARREALLNAGRKALREHLQSRQRGDHGALTALAATKATQTLVK